VETKATDNGTRLFHIKATAAQLNFSVVTTAGEGESAAEGEGSDLVESVSTRSIVTTDSTSDSASAIELGSTSVVSTNSSSATAKSPAAILHSLTGRARLASNTSPDPAAVDAAMLQLAPSLRLSSDLEEALTGDANDEEFGLAADQLLGN
jgi:hypothetical protein